MRDRKTKSGAYSLHLQGQAAVWATASKLALIGHVPCFPGVDFGFDLLLENGLRLQVKSSQIRMHPGYELGGYCFELRRFNRVDPDRSRNYASDCDFLVFWGVNENRFWIVPSAQVNRSAMWFPTKAQQDRPTKRASQWPISKIREFEDRWDLLDVNSAVEQTLSEVVTHELAEE